MTSELQTRIDRELRERDMRSQGALVLAFRTLCNTSPRDSSVQVPLLGTASALPRSEQPAGGAGASPAPTIVREFSTAGPCLTRGRLVRQTAQFYVWHEWRGGDKFDSNKERRGAIRTAARYSPLHVEPCESCLDHPHTHYPNGYMD